MDPLQLQKLTPSSPLTPAELLRSTQPTEGGVEGASFGDILKQAIQEVQQARTTAENEAQALMTGESTDMHAAMLAVQKADVSFQMMMAVRTKLVDAYREVMRMQI